MPEHHIALQVLELMGSPCLVMPFAYPLPNTAVVETTGDGAERGRALVG